MQITVLGILLLLFSKGAKIQEIHKAFENEYFC